VSPKAVAGNLDFPWGKKGDGSDSGSPPSKQEKKKKTLATLTAVKWGMSPFRGKKKGGGDRKYTLMPRRRKGGEKRRERSSLPFRHSFIIVQSFGEKGMGLPVRICG